MLDKNKVLNNIEKLKASNIQTVIDDFGTGYSSLSMLSDLPLDFIKLDKSLLDKAENEKGKVFYQHIVELLHKMDKTLVAEGVENDMQLKFINQLGIAVVQGWVYQKAIPKHEIADYLNNLRSV